MYAARKILMLGLTGLLLNGCGDDNSETQTQVAAPSADLQQTAARVEAPESAAPATPAAIAPAVAAAPQPAPEAEVTQAMPTELAGAEVAAAAESEPDKQSAADSTPTAAEPVQHEILGVVTQWRPMITYAQPGDTLVFKQMAGHDSETIDGLIPDGAETWKSKMGEEGFSVTVTTPGAYIFKCNPHVSTGMVGVVVVGDKPPQNLAALEEHKLNKGMIGRAIRKLKKALAE